jgi:nitrate/nitrite transport system substrate-binding protein
VRAPTALVDETETVRNRTVRTFAGVDRRRFLKAGGAAALGAVALPSFLAACSDDSGGGGGGGGGRDVTLGFIALTDFSALAIAKEKGFFAERDLDVTVRRETSWATTRDNLLSGEIDGAHCLYSMPFSLATGIGDEQASRDMRIAMMLSQNGQAISLGAEFAAAGVGYADLDGARDVLSGMDQPTMAMTFPGGTHDLWLEYWLLAMGFDPRTDIDVQTVPPPEMVANMTAGNMRGFCVGEPWNAVAVSDGVGFTHLTTQDLWEHHPEKALVVGKRFAEQREDVLKDVMGAIFDASKWLDDLDNRPEAAEIVAPQAYINAPADDLESRLMGDYDLGADLGSMSFDGTQMMYHRDGLVNFPRRGHAIWAMAQYQRFGYLDEAPPYMELADEIILTDLYEEVANAEGVDIPDDDMAPFEVKLDGVTFDPRNPDEEASRP